MDPSIVDKAVQLGSKQFQQRNFSKALKIFARGIEAARLPGGKYHPRYRTLLDSRSACFAKLGSLDKALDDAKTLIEVDPYGTKGYLRKSKLLTAAGEDQQAFDTLDRGIKKIQRGMEKHGSKLKVNEQLLSRMFAERDEIAESLGYVRDGAVLKKPRRRDLDFMKALPFEISVGILRLLAQRDVLACRLVSKTWDEHVRLSGWLVNPRLRSPVSKETFQLFSNYTSSTRVKSMQTLRLRCRPSDERAIMKMVMNGPKLNELRVLLNGMSNQDLVRLLSQSTAGRALFARLHRLELHLPVVDYGFNMNDLLKYLVGLTSLRVVVSHWQTVPAIAYINKFVPNRFQVQELVLATPNVSPQFATDFFKNNLFSSLKSLELVDCSPDLDLLATLVNPELKSLALHHVRGVDMSWLASHLDGVHLQSLKLVQFAEPSPPEVVVEDLGFLADVTSLSLVNTQLSLNSFDKILDATDGHLQDLTLDGNAYIPFEYGPVRSRQPTRLFSFKMMLQRCPNLAKLSLLNGTSFTDNALRTLGIEINQLKPDQLRELNLSNNQVTDHGLLCLFSGWLHLNRLEIVNCDISTRVIRWLQTEYVREIKFHD